MTSELEPTRDVEIAAGRSMAARILGVGFLLLAAALTCTCVFVRSVAPHIDQDKIRTTSTLSSLPLIAANPGPTVLLFGSSAIEWGIAPVLVDAELARMGRQVTSFNLGFSDFTPQLLRDMAEHTRAAFEQAHHRAQLTALDFMPILATRARHVCKANAETELKMAIAATPRSVWRSTIESPSSGFRILIFRYGYGGSMTDGIGGWLATQLFTPPNWWPEQPAPPLSEDDRKLVEARTTMHTYIDRIRPLGEVWSAETRGFWQFIYPQTRDAYEYLLWHKWMTPELLKADVEDRRTCGDFDNLVFDDLWVDDYIEAVKLMKTISDRTVLMLLPRNRWVAEPLPAGLARLRATVERISREAGVPVLDLSAPPEITAQDFIDLIHVNELTGVPKLSSLVARAIARQLPPPHDATAE